ncbi:hypothetical protein Btru_072023 [Bulinus truncatus]|nr:hypothetical protein Btru_072023 [Bulinus truncatus]
MFQLIVFILASMFALTHGGCNAFGKQAQPGEVFTIPGHSHCFHYKCYNGVANLYREGCELDGKCYDVGFKFVIDCVTYVCKKVLENGNSVYKSIITCTECQDNNGLCHRPGGAVFSRIVGGVLFKRCTCALTGPGHVTYNCQHK